MDYLVLAFYWIKGVDTPREMIKRWKAFLGEIDAKGRIYISEGGVNAQMSVAMSDQARFEEWIEGELPDADVKVHVWDEHPFAKLTVKYRKQLVAMDKEVDLSDQGEYLDGKSWREMIEKKDENTILIDVRNDYEWEIGHFEGALMPKLKTFREFPKYAESLKEQYDPETTTVMMCCTGGIRCGFYSPLMKELGFKKVYQLRGGIIRYGLEEGGAKWHGKLFVFDDRLVVPLNEDAETIAKCHQCGCKSDSYYNCAHMDCNKLFISCPDCAAKMEGCCSSECIEAPRRREFVPGDRVRPYRKLPYEEKAKL